MVIHQYKKLQDLKPACVLCGLNFCYKTEQLTVHACRIIVMLLYCGLVVKLKQHFLIKQI